MIQLFLDLDGVLADFDEGIILNNLKKEVDCESKNQYWKQIRKIGTDYTNGFFSTLPMMKDAKYLWNELKGFNPVILTGIPFGDWAPPQKKFWVKTNLGENVKVITCRAKEKGNYARQYCGNNKFILIDDLLSNSQNVIDNNGVFILHENAEKSVKLFHSTVKELS